MARERREDAHKPKTEEKGEKMPTARIEERRGLERERREDASQRRQRREDEM